MSRVPGPILVTGASTGLGLVCARVLAAEQQRAVWLGSRDPGRTAAAAAQVAEATRNAHVEAMTLDLASLAAVRDFAASVAARVDGQGGRPLAGLVCNAGVQVAGPLTYTVDGFETMFGVNHLGHFLLVRLLLPYLAPDARIVIVSSGTHDPATIDGRFNAPRFTTPSALAWPERPGGVRMSGIRRYATTKLCNLYFAYELDRRLRRGEFGPAAQGIVVNAYDPGATPDTGLVRDYPAWAQAVWQAPVTARLLRLAGLRVYTRERSGAAMARLLTDPTLAGVSGRYFHVEQEMPSSRASRDLAAARLLWDASEAMTGLRPVAQSAA